MSPTLFHLLLILSLFAPSQPLLQSTDNSFISLLVSQNGLDFVKDLLVNKAISSLTPLEIPQIEKTMKIPVLGNVHTVLSNIIIYRIDVSSSYVKSGETGVAIVASGTTCNLSMNWYYSYSSWAVPFKISDHGSASVQVEGMEVGLTLGLVNRRGSLELSLMDCGCYVKDISITLDGGASWLYQGIVDAFDEQIGSAVEYAITKKLVQGVLKLDSFLQALPKKIKVDDTASLNVTFVNDLSLSNSSIGLKINGLFTRNGEDALPNNYLRSSQLPVSCTDSSKMLGISLDEDVFNSASTLYYNAKFMMWIVNEVTDKSLLNTAGWRFIVPQLYKKYPNDDMNMNLSLSSPPVIRISADNIDATVYADLIIDVLDGPDVIPVACISLVFHGSGSVEVVKNNLAGSVKLNDFSMLLKWSKIGNLRMFIIQPIMWTIIETVFLPYVNLHLAKGFPLPIIHGFTLQNAEIICSNSNIKVCSDVAIAESYDLSQLPIEKHFSYAFRDLQEIA
ncbi:BPI/LBP family protein precursor [Actinidia chinensis var. chinensis]|uniref:BPI/LBP family protein n=1 Tax=Actinidia chinensis var. chinensis TaxID=1590841 RepID=A0A2R6QCV3_ACTCC|nr:BPI/LBP family protein precursor [Actinidia chinensis var. chinensis]